MKCHEVKQLRNAVGHCFTCGVYVGAIGPDF